MTKKVFKYCTSEVYDWYLSKGVFQFGTLEKYRKDFEGGAGYADEYEGRIDENVYGEFDSKKSPELKERLASYGISGNFKAVAPIAITIPTITNFHVLSTAKSYENDSHRKWYERQNCNYDICIEFDLKRLIEKLVAGVKLLDSVALLCGATVTYQDKNFDMENIELTDRQKLLFSVFGKPEHFCWENEYRFVVQLKEAIGTRDVSPLRIKLNDIDEAILDVHRFTS